MTLDTQASSNYESDLMPLPSRRRVHGVDEPESLYLRETNLTNSQVSATSSRGGEASQLVAQASAGLLNCNGCPTRSYVRGTRFAKAARRCADVGEGYTEPKKPLSLRVAHARADLATS
jgi:hypothetical protein